MIKQYNGRPTWTSNDNKDAYLQFCVQEWEAIHVLIHSRNSYMPVGLTVSQTRELIESLENQTSLVMFIPIGYKGNEITFTILYELDEIIFMARYKDSLTGHIVNYSNVKDMVKVLNLLIDITEQDIIARAKTNA